MKTLAKNLKQAIDALEFSNTNHLHGLTTKLSTLEKLSTLDRSATPARPGHNGNHLDDSFGSITGSATASH